MQKSGPRVLLADDDALVRKLIQAILAREGYDVSLCEDGGVALERFKEGGWSLLVLDFNMPRLTGLEVIRKLRAAGEGIPALLVSGQLDDTVIGECRKLGRVECVHKPFEAAGLTAAIARLQASVPDQGQGGPGADRLDEFRRLNRPAAPRFSVERRKYTRFEVDEAPASFLRPGTVSLSKRSQKGLEVLAMDLAEGGVRLLVGKRLPLDTKIHITVQIVELKDTVDSDGTVRWCHPCPGGKDEFRTGVMFSGLDPTLEKKISTLRGWFTSPHAWALRENRLREKGLGH